MRRKSIRDGPPGIGCPVIAAVGGVDAGLIVVEPSLAGIHDMERALEMLEHFKIPAFICINTYDINPVQTDRIVTICDTNDVEVMGQIPFDPLVTQAMVAGKSVIEYAPTSLVAESITTVWNQTLTTLQYDVMTAR